MLHLTVSSLLREPNWLKWIIPLIADQDLHTNFCTYPKDKSVAPEPEETKFWSASAARSKGCCGAPRFCLSDKLWKRACKKRDAVHAVEPLVVDCVLIYFNPTPGFSGRCCRCLKLNKAFNVSAVMLCLRPVYALTPRWRLSHRLWQQLWYMLIISYVFVHILHWIFFSISDNSSEPAI